VLALGRFIVLLLWNYLTLTLVKRRVRRPNRRVRSPNRRVRLPFRVWRRLLRLLLDRLQFFPHRIATLSNACL